MKKFAALFVITIICCNVSKAQYVNLPDSNFRNYLRDIYPECFNAAGEMDTTCNEIVTEDSIDFYRNPSYAYLIKNLDGIRYFKSLKMLNTSTVNFLETLSTLPQSLLYLNCGNNRNLASLPFLPPSLQFLNCRSCRLDSLPDLPATLNYLDCSENYQIRVLPTLPAQLKHLDFSTNRVTVLPALLPSTLEYLAFTTNKVFNLPPLPRGLKHFDCGYNDSITILPSLSDSLEYLGFYHNQVRAIPTLPTKLLSLVCSNNPIYTLPSIPSSLTSLDCEGDSLTSLPPLPNQLRSLWCGANQLTSFSTLPDSLRYFYCYSNNIAYLPVSLPPFLEQLHCGNNQIINMPPLPQTLTRLVCYNNQLSSLPDLPQRIEILQCSGNNITCLPVIPGDESNPRSLYISFDGTKIKCLPNYFRFANLNALDSIGSNLPLPPLCNPTNNIFHCQSFPVMQGLIFYDNNNNGIKDTGEPVRNNGPVSLSNGKFSFSNNTGQYEIGADSIGNYSLTATAPRYFNYAPAAYNYNFTTYDTLVTGNFALQANTVIDELTLHITPINWAARPGFSFPYLISYENTGTTTLSPTIVFDYDETRLNYNTSSVAGVVDNANNLAYNTGSLVPGQSGSFIGYFTLKTTVPLGDTVNAKAIISANTFTAYDSVQTTVRGAIDPNDKQATPQLSPSQVANGKYIDYTIRFQNTGTDTAFNIVVSDTLSDDLQAGSLEMLVSSHTCKATVKDNIVFFEFLNILLPDSNVNEGKSHGFVSFKIKPQTTVAVNTTIPNKAAIYFDYNTPVITNTSGTLIKDFIVVPLKLVSFSAVPQMDNTTTLYWNTANEINTKQFVIQQSSNGLRFTAVKNVMAKGRASNNYSSSVNEAGNSLLYYRLKIVDNDGSFSYSPIIKIDRRKNTSGIAEQANPAKDFIIINTTDRSLNNTTASIINMQGAVVKSFIVKEGSQAVDIKALPAGIYYLKTESGSSRILVQ